VGLALLSIIGIIVSIVLLASIFTAPRKSKVVGIFFAAIILQVLGAAVFAYVISILFSLVVPP
jgi:hypothetical protein